MASVGDAAAVAAARGADGSREDASGEAPAGGCAATAGTFGREAEAASRSRAALLQQAINAANAAVSSGGSAASVKHALDVAISVKKQLPARARIRRDG